MSAPPRPSEARDLQLLRDAGRDGASVDELVHLVGEPRPVVRSALRALSRRGEALRLDRNLFVAAEAGGRFEGTLRYVPHARAWVVKTEQCDVAVFEDGLAGAVPGDAVEGTLISGGGQPVGVIKSVTERGPREYEAVLRRFRGAWLGASEALGEPVYLPNVGQRASVGERVTLHIEGRTRWKRGRAAPSRPCASPPAQAQTVVAQRSTPVTRLRARCRSTRCRVGSTRVSGTPPCCSTSW